MQRREILRGMAVAAAMPALAAVPAERLHALEQAARPDPGTPPRALTAHQFATVRSIAAMIIPATDTPGALEAATPEFTDTLLADFYPAADRDTFLAGLADLDQRANAQSGGHGGFVALKHDGRVTLLTALDGQKGEPGSAEHMLSRLKAMTVYGYFTSRVVMVDVLHTPIWPGRFDGCAPVAGTKAG